MPGGLLTLLANNAAHVVPGGRRKKTQKKRRRGGYTDWSVVRKEQAEEVMNRYGCKEIPACLSILGQRIREAETRDQMIPLRRDRMTLLAHQDDLTGGAAGRTREQIIADIERILIKHGCGNYTPESARTCQDVINTKLDDPNLQPGAPYRAVLNDFTLLNNYLVELRNVGGRKKRSTKKTRRASA